MTTLTIQLICQGLSGRQGGLHLGLQRGSEVIDPVPATAGSVHFALTVEVTPIGDGGAFDARGPYVHGRRGDRFLYLSWGELDRDGAFGMVMRTKIKLEPIEPDLVVRALESGAALRGTLSLVDAAGKPVTGTVPSERIEWAIVPGAEPG
ncbi:MAG: hypothetical protein AVDCRST_MAG87-614 [uncultured Thermomicrobiales bacterium]|uniref:Uncharacterized protein n=1 Tax=uncultured Thermomicrobiales bacterium TaxID=1645740 RepID=A0A6J4UEI5_9BACT|nr:MAG: hypothetical protein AVDCRST_MAG87-614 [uncultured Thermomicrobiales bacterium]